MTSKQPQPMPEGAVRPAAPAAPPKPDKTTSFNKLPVVITGPGEYLMRNGGKALIHEVKEYEDPKGEFTRLEVTAFEAKGAPYKMFRGKMRARGLYIWHVSGRYSVFSDSAWDIVAPLPKLECSHADTCLPSFWSGTRLPHLQVMVSKGMTLGAVKAALRSELNEGALMGSNVGDDAWSEGPDGTAWYLAAAEAVDAITASDGGGGDTELFLDLEEQDEEDDCCESVYAFFVFTEVE